MVGGGVVHFNNAGASPSPPIVVETIIAHLNDETENGGYLAAARAKPRLDRVYASVARLVNAKSGGGDPRRVIALVESATVAWTRIFYSMAEQLARSAEEEARIAGGNVVQRTILMSEAEYAANVVAADALCSQKAPTASPEAHPPASPTKTAPAATAATVTGAPDAMATVAPTPVPPPSAPPPPFIDLVRPC